MISPSPLGAALEAAIDRDPRYRRRRGPIQYLCSYTTLGGRVFAFERVTKSQINLWLPDDPAVWSVAEREGLPITKSVPWHSSAKYGRIHSLKAIPELRDATLYRIAVTSAAQAMAVVGALA